MLFNQIKKRSPPFYRGVARFVILLFCVFFSIFETPLGLALDRASGHEHLNASLYVRINGFNQERLGFIKKQKTITPTQMHWSVQFSTLNGDKRIDSSEIQTLDGQWVTHPLDTHGLSVPYAFSPYLRVHPSLAEKESRWSEKIKAHRAGDEHYRIVRVDGQTMGEERITVPAGSFLTQKIQLIIYPGDSGDFKSETRIQVRLWYELHTQELIRSETRSNWRLLAGCRRGPCNFDGDWLIEELMSVSSTAQNPM
jgi:hypothetical protein